MPLRQFTGLDARRMQQLLAVMDRDTPLRSYSANIFVNIVGGFQVQGIKGRSSRGGGCRAGGAAEGAGGCRSARPALGAPPARRALCRPRA